MTHQNSFWMSTFTCLRLLRGLVFPNGEFLKKEASTPLQTGQLIPWSGQPPLCSLTSESCQDDELALTLDPPEGFKCGPYHPAPPIPHPQKLGGLPCHWPHNSLRIIMFLSPNWHAYMPQASRDKTLISIRVRQKMPYPQDQGCQWKVLKERTYILW